MRALLAAFSMITVVGTAHADTYELSPPDGWDRHDELAAGVSRRALAEKHFGDSDFKAATVAWVDQGVGALYLTSLLADDPSPDLESEARAELDSLRATANAAGPASSVEIVSWDEANQDGVVGATFHWRHLSNETETIARQLVFADADDRLRVFRAECVLAADASDEARGKCRRALSSLEVEAKTAERNAIGTLPAPAEPNDDSVPELRKDLEPIPGSGAEIGEPGDDERTVLYENEPEDVSGSHRWLFVGGAIVLIVGFYLTARARGQRADEEGDDQSGEDGDDQSGEGGDGESGEDSDERANTAGEGEGGESDPDGDDQGPRPA